jgi:predicted PurR-regulated permease PerM
VCVLAIGLVIVALVRLRIVVLPIVVALFLATLLKPVSDRLRARGLRPAPAAGFTLVGGLGLLGTVFGVIAFQLGAEADRLVDDFSTAVDELEVWFVDGPLGLDDSTVDTARERVAESVEDNSDALTRGALWVGTVALEVVAGGALAVVLLFFILKDGHRAGAALDRVVEPRMADDLKVLGAKAWDTMGGYLRGVALTGVVEALIIGVALALLGVPLVVPLMLLTFLAAFVPMVGATAAGVLAAMVALVSNGPGTALAVAVLVFLVQQMEGDLLAPLILGRAVHLHPVTILLALTAGGVLAGIVGAFLAVPFAALAKTVVEHYRPPREPDLAAVPGAG